MVTTTGPMGAAVVLLVVALVVVWRYVARPFLGELHPISGNLKDTAIANREARVGLRAAAVARKEAAEAWRETAQVAAQLRGGGGGGGGRN